MAKIKQSVKKTGRGRKELIVAELVERIDASSGLVFTDYKGLTHQQLENLKKELKKQDATIIIAKNSLLKISLGKSKNFADFKDNEGLELPTATLFIGGDMVEPLKQLQKVIKEAGLPKIKFAVLEGQLVDESGVLKIASLPSRETLIAKFLWTLNSPIQGFVVTLNGTIQKLVMTLDAVAKTKPAPAAPAPVTEAEQTKTPTEQTVAESPDQAKTEPETSEAAPAEQPAVQPAAPVETDESADAGTETLPTQDTEEKNEESVEPTEETKEEEQNETENEGGEK